MQYFVSSVSKNPNPKRSKRMTIVKGVCDVVKASTRNMSLGISWDLRSRSIGVRKTALKNTACCNSKKLFNLFESQLVSSLVEWVYF